MRFNRIAFTLTVIFIALAGATAPASAAVTPAPTRTAALNFVCPQGSLCVYTDAYYSGYVYEWNNLHSGQCVNLLQTSVNDAISSVHNYTNKRVRFFADGCGNFLGTSLAAGSSWGNLAGTGWNDVFSSWDVP